MHLPDELCGIRERWREADRDKREAIYAAEFGPAWAPHFAALPLEGGGEALPAPKALVAVLGMSWQPVALMAAKTQANHVLLLGTRESFGLQVEGEDAAALIARLSGVARSRFQLQHVDTDPEVSIYRAVQDFVRGHGYGPGEVWVDPTGGKKSMSAAASLAGFLLGLPLVYVDYREYDSRGRIPLPGSEYPRLLRNPLEELGDLEYRGIVEAFNGGRYDEARRRAMDLGKRMYEPWRAQLYEKLSAGYAAWDAFNFTRAAAELEEARSIIRRFGGRPDWKWTEELLPWLTDHVELLGVLAGKKGVDKHGEAEFQVRILNHLAAARRAVGEQRYVHAVMMLYSTVEHYAKTVLARHYGIDDRRLPDLEGDFLERYRRAGKAFLGPRFQERPLRAPLGMTVAVLLLAACRDTAPLHDALGDLGKLMNARNRCAYSHELKPQVVTEKEAKQSFDAVRAVLVGHDGEGWREEAERLLERMHFPKLPVQT